MILKVGNQNCFAKLGTIGVGVEYKVEIDVDWTYQEFFLKPVKGRGLKKIVVNSDDCCDFELLTVTESGGKFQVDKVARGQSNTCFAMLGTIGVGGEYKVEIDVDWTYQEFFLKPVKGRGLKKIVVNSDDCCDFERLTVTESGGKFQLVQLSCGGIPPTNSQTCFLVGASS